MSETRCLWSIKCFRLAVWAIPNQFPVFKKGICLKFDEFYHDMVLKKSACLVFMRPHESGRILLSSRRSVGRSVRPSVHNWFPEIISESTWRISTKFHTGVPWVDAPTPVDFRTGPTTGVPPSGSFRLKFADSFPMIILESTCRILTKFHTDILWVDVPTPVDFRTGPTTGAPPGGNFS